MHQMETEMHRHWRHTAENGVPVNQSVARTDHPSRDIERQRVMGHGVSDFDGKIYPWLNELESDNLSRCRKLKPIIVHFFRNGAYRTNHRP